MKVYLERMDGNSLLLLNLTEDLCHPPEEANGFQLKSIMHSMWLQYTNIPLGCPVEAVSQKPFTV